MKTIDQLLRSLARTDVTEFAMVSSRLPCVKVGGAYQPVDDSAPSRELVMRMLSSVGGQGHLERLGPKPTNWTTRVDGVGTVSVAAILRDGTVQARFAVVRREPTPDNEPVRPEPPSLRAPQRPSPAPQVGRPQVGDTARSPGGFPPLPIVGTLREIDLEPNGPPSGGSLSFELDMSDRMEPLALATTERDFELGIDGKMSRSGRPPPVPSFASPAASLAPTVPVAPALPRVSVDVPPTALLLHLVGVARSLGASDLHIVADRPPLFRIAGELVPRGDSVSPETAAQAILPSVPLRCRPTLEHDGSCDFALHDITHGRMRVNVSRQRTGLKACLRLIPNEIPTLESLGLPVDIARATHHHQGLIVVTGPTGHGKTSTLAAIVDIINRDTSHHIITVEDPVEYVHPRKKAMMSQREVGTHTRSFPNALKASLREDPDIIVVGELRDTETVRMALSASETGHLVIGTMNTQSAAKSIDRLIDLFPPADQGQVRMTLAGGLRLIVGQRLLPNLNRTGLVVAAEVLPGSIPLWSLIRDNKLFQIPSLQQRGKALGITRLDDSLLELVRTGKTSPEAAIAVAEAPEEFEAVLARRAAPEAAVLPQQGPSKGILQKAGTLFGKKA